MLFCLCWHLSPEIFQKYRSHLQILGVRRMTWIKLHTEDPQILSDVWTSLLSVAFCPVHVNYYTLYGMKTNWCHCFIRILLDLYMFRAHRPIFRRVRTAVHTTIGSVSVPLCSEHANRAAQILNQWLCEKLYELSWRWACGAETCRDPAIYE